MVIRRWAAPVVFFVTLLSRSSNAGTTELTLAEALDRAARQSPHTLLGRRLVREAEGRKIGAGVVTPTNPRISADGRPLLGEGSLRDTGYAATLDLLFEVGGAPRARALEAQASIAVAKDGLAVDVLNARSLAFEAYVRAKVAEARVAEVRRMLEISARVESAAAQRTSAGASGDIELSLSRAALAETRSELEGTERLERGSVMQLREVLDLDANESVALTTSIDDLPDLPTAAELFQRARIHRPELRLAKSRLSLLEATESRLAKETFPKIGAYVGVDAAPRSSVFGVLGLSVEIPVFQRNQGARAATRAGEDAEIVGLEVSVRQIAREIGRHCEAFAARRRELGTLSKDALPAAQRTLELVDTGWQAGRFDVFRITSAARDVARLRGLRLDALEAAWIERIAALRAAGGMDL